jgi:uncharacterized protein (DUF2132 family)
VKREQESTYLKVQKMMRGKVKLFVLPTMVRVVETMVWAVKQIIAIPQMTSPKKKQSRE